MRTKYVLDLAQLPEGIDVEQWMYYFKNHGMAFINSSKENNAPSITRLDNVSDVKFTKNNITVYHGE
jgi:hypothetical protein